MQKTFLVVSTNLLDEHQLVKVIFLCPQVVMVTSQSVLSAKENYM